MIDETSGARSGRVTVLQEGADNGSEGRQHEQRDHEVGEHLSQGASLVQPVDHPAEPAALFYNNTQEITTCFQRK